MTAAQEIFNQDALTTLFPAQRSDDFFDALFGDKAEGSYDIHLKFINHTRESKELFFELHLIERPGKCLGCNLTYGLPEVFSRHPIINIKGLANDIAKALEPASTVKNWQLQNTRIVSSNLHIIPLVIELS